MFAAFSTDFLLYVGIRIRFVLFSTTKVEGKFFRKNGGSFEGNLEYKLYTYLKASRCILGKGSKKQFLKMIVVFGSQEIFITEDIKSINHLLEENKKIFYERGGKICEKV